MAAGTGCLSVFWQNKTHRGLDGLHKTKQLKKVSSRSSVHSRKSFGVWRFSNEFSEALLQCPKA